MLIAVRSETNPFCSRKEKHLIFPLVFWGLLHPPTHTHTLRPPELGFPAAGRMLGGLSFQYLKGLSDPITSKAEVRGPRMSTGVRHLD
jgi:hypothetical protein